MTPKHEAAKFAMETFVLLRGGETADIRLELGQGLQVASYSWEDQVGGFAAVGWAEATDGLAQVERERLR